MKNILAEVDDNLDATEIKCPVCGGDFVNFHTPNYVESDNYQAWKGRGNAIHIPMFCQEMHHFKVTIGFHKGHSFFKVAIE
jgi:hypothetical protein